MSDVRTLFDLPRKRASARSVPDSAETGSDSRAKKTELEKAELERRLADGELDGVRTRTAFILNQYPSCRNSDVELTVRYWKMFHPDEVGSESVEYGALRAITPM